MQMTWLRILPWVCWLVSFLLAVTVARAQIIAPPDRVVRMAGLEVAIWMPTGPGPHPLVLFSHAFGGCKTKSSYLMQALALHGMVVAAPDHADNECAIGRPPATLPPSLLSPATWSATFYAGRRDDIQALRVAIEADTTFSGWIDPSHVALIGHSLGGYTVLGLAGAWPNWKMDGIAAVVALAPFAQPFLNGGALGNISVPVFFQGGTEDFTTLAFDRGGIFAGITAPACKVIYRDARHFAWTDLETDFHIATADATIAFLDEVFAGRFPSEAALASAQSTPPECK